MLKAVGFTDRGVLGLVLAESSLLAMLGGFLGLGVAWMFITWIGDPSGGALPIFFLPIKDLVLGIVLVLLLGLVTGLLPALQAQRLQIADAMRR